MVILGTQLYPLSVKIFCLQEAANQKKAGAYLIYGTVLKVWRSQKPQKLQHICLAVIRSVNSVCC